MSVLSVNWVPDGRNGESKGNFAVEDDRVCRIITSSSYDDTHTILQSGLLPGHGSGHPNNPWSTLRSWQFRPAIQGNGRIWYGTAKYSSQPETREEKEKRVQPNPLLRAAKVSFRFEKRQYTRTKDKNGRPYKTSAGEAVVSPPKTKSVSILEITKNLPGYPSFFFTHADKVNSSTVVIYTPLGPLPPFAARSLKFNPLSIVDIQEEGGIPYVEARYEFEISSNSFTTDILNYGIWYKDGIGNLITDGVKEVFLTMTGTKLAAGDPETYTPHYDEEEADFSGLPIS